MEGFYITDIETPRNRSTAGQDVEFGTENVLELSIVPGIEKQKKAGWTDQEFKRIWGDLQRSGVKMWEWVRREIHIKYRERWEVRTEL